MEGGCVLSSDSASTSKTFFMPTDWDPQDRACRAPRLTPLDENRDKLLDTTFSLESEREALTKPGTAVARCGSHHGLWRQTESVVLTGQQGDC